MDENKKIALLPKTAFAQNLAELLGSEDYKRKALADELGITKSAVSKWINNDSEPGFAVLLYLSELFEVPVDYLLKDHNKPDEGYVLMKIPTRAIPCVKEVLKLAVKG